jgi:hypothetical protein
MNGKEINTKYFYIYYCSEFNTIKLVFFKFSTAHLNYFMKILIEINIIKTLIFTLYSKKYSITIYDIYTAI